MECGSERLQALPSTHHSSPQLMLHNTPPPTSHSFSCFLISQEVFSLGSCVSPASWLAKMCHLGSYSACFVRCSEHVKTVTFCVTLEPNALVVTRVLTRGQTCRAADDTPNYWDTETQTTTHSGNAQECNKLGMCKKKKKSVWARV